MKAYICIGGPLDGQFATSKDFQRETAHYLNPHMKDKWLKDHPESREISDNGGYAVVSIPAGRYENYSNQYVRFNCGHRGNRCSMVWIHVSLLKSPINAGR